MSLRVAVLDDHQLFRQGLRALLSEHPHLSLIGEAGNAREAYDMVDKTQPDVVLVDLRLPGTDGIAATREIKRRQPRCRVMVLTATKDEHMVRQAFAAGALGYFVKSESANDLVRGIETVGADKPFLSPGLPESLLDDGNGRNGKGHGDPLGTLSEREREIFNLVFRGFTNKAIAKELCISPKTVETHRAHINKKLGLHSTADLVRFAASNGYSVE